MPNLRPYQRAALEAISSTFKRGLNRLLIKKPTGTGKTVMFAELKNHLGPWLSQFRNVDRRMLVIAHREELLDQAQEKIQAANPKAYVAIEQADRVAPISADIIVASIQTLAAGKFRRLHRLLQGGPFRVVIIDEAHHAAADTYRTALVHLGFLPAAEGSDVDNVEAPDWDDVEQMKAALEGWDKDAPKDRLLVGVTATPNRTDAIGLGCVFQEIAFSYDLKAAIDDKWLVPIVPWVIESDTSLDAVKTTHGDFNQGQLADAVNNGERNKLAVAGWHDYGAGLSTLAFTVDVQHAHDLATAFRAAGVEAAAVSGETPRPERRQLLDAFRDGRLTVLSNCMVLTEGTDLPMASCILHAKPTKSATLYEQMTGRGLRIHPGKDRCVVIDVVDIARKHSLQTAAVLYGLPPGLKGDGESLEELKALWDELQAKYPGLELEGVKTLEQLRAKAATFDIWAVRPLEHHGEGLGMTWLRVGDEAFRLEYPWGAPDTTEILDVRKNLLGKFELVVYERQFLRDLRRSVASAERVLGAGVPTANACLKLAEAFVRQERSRVLNLKRSDAPWMARPASDKQLALLRRRKIPVPPGCTMGQASQLIDLMRARGR